MKKSLIITLAIVVVLVGAGVLVYNLAFRHKTAPGKDVTMIAVRWNKVGYDSGGNYLSTSLTPLTSVEEALNPITPEMILFNRGESWHSISANKQSLKLDYTNKRGNKLEYTDFLKFVYAANMKSPVMLYKDAIKGSAAINTGDIVAVWEEIDKDKFNSKPVQEIIRSENDPNGDELFPEKYFYLEQENGKVARFKLYRGLTKGEGTASFRFLSKSAYPVIESMKVEVK